jgi:phosphatidylserine/phosphatidylglycerophosphate/cardiolipin synthase-like enzyme
MQADKAVAESGGLRVVAYPGDNKILIAISLDQTAISETAKNLAGFAIFRKPAGKAEVPLSNRLTFTISSTATTVKWTPSNQAPFQKFRWIDVPPDGVSGAIAYRVKALYFAGSGTTLKDGPQVSVTVQQAQAKHTNFRASFTRGYIASQAYADKFGNKDIRPKGAHTPDFNTKPFQPQYVWLGAGARAALFDFIGDCESDKSARVNVFAYDLDEPDIVAAICRFGKEGRLRAILDNASLHVASGTHNPPEVKAAQMIIAAAGAANVRQGHFDRFQHNKVFIKRDASGRALRVLFGSMNFSVRGVYVQANNIAVVDDPTTAGMFAAAFDLAFADNVTATPFRANKIAAGYMAASAADTAALPKFSLALSPHSDATVSLGPMAQRIQTAQSSVLFAVMAPEGGGPVLDSLRKIASWPFVFSYGTVETDKGLAVQKPDGAMGAVTGFAALTKNVPPPFKAEFSGGPGIHIHDKFVVVDFNGANPSVFMGSSNLAAGGEEQNGDSLAMIEDEAIASMYAIEAVALFDHFHFNEKANAATAATPLTLWFPGKAGQPAPWWKPYYDQTQIQFRDRCLFAGVPLPPGLKSVKHADWGPMDAVAKPKPAKPRRKAAATPSAKPRRKTTRKPAARRAPARRRTRKKPRR